MKRENYGFEYTGPQDSSRLILETELTEEVVFDHLKRVLSNVSAMPLWAPEYDAAHPPPVVSFCFYPSSFIVDGWIYFESVFFFFVGLWSGF